MLIVACSTAVFAQNNYELGLDLTEIFIYAGGGERAYSELDLLFRKKREQGELRFKFNINNYNYYLTDSIARFSVVTEDAPGEPREDEYYVIYDPAWSYQLGFGISRFKKESKLPLYYGIDFNLGLGRGYARTFQEDFITQPFNFPGQVAAKANYFGVIGLTPFLGIKKELSGRLSIGLEFGYNINYVFGDIRYYNHDLSTFRGSVNHLDISKGRILNDIAVFYRF
jgi:hypothetical protein